MKSSIPTSKRSRQSLTQTSSSTTTTTRTESQLNQQSDLPDQQQPSKRSRPRKALPKQLKSPESKSEQSTTCYFCETTLPEKTPTSIVIQTACGHCKEMLLEQLLSGVLPILGRPNGRCISSQIPCWSDTWISSGNSLKNTTESSSTTCPSTTSQESLSSIYSTGTKSRQSTADTNLQQSQDTHPKFSRQTLPLNRSFRTTNLAQSEDESQSGFTSHSAPSYPPLKFKKKQWLKTPQKFIPESLQRHSPLLKTYLTTEEESETKSSTPQDSAPPEHQQEMLDKIFWNDEDNCWTK